MRRPHILWHETFCGKYERHFDWLRRWLVVGDWETWHSRWRGKLYLTWAFRAHWAVEDEAVYEWMRREAK